MNRIKYAWIFVLVCLISSCQSDYTKNKAILNAEELLWSSPDSAYLILNDIKQPEKLSKGDYAAWCLHYTHAMYKLQKEINSDSLIQISINYYSKSRLTKYNGTAWYLAGCIYSTLDQKQDAISAFKKAEDILRNTNESRLKGLVAFNIGYTSMQDEFYSHSLNYFQKSLEYFKESDDSNYMAYAYREIANMYDQQSYPVDSVIFYLDLALNLSNQIGDSINFYSILIKKGKLLLETDCFNSKELVLKAYKYFPDYKPYYAAYLASAYSKLGNQDSAKYYLDISLSDSTNSPYKIIGFHAATSIAKSENNYKEALNYLEDAYTLRESTYKYNMRSQLYSIDKQYDFTLKEVENAQLKIDNRNMIILISLLVIAGLTILIVFLLINSKHKRIHAINEIDKQKLKYASETTQIKNTQKRELLEIRLQNKIVNTLQFNKFNRGYLQKEKMEIFIQEIAKQSIISEKEWIDYVNEVDSLFDNRITSLKQEYSELTIADLNVIILIGLKVNISDACNLLDMSKNTMYTRRRTIKVRLKLEDNINLEEWITDYLSKE